MENRILAAAAAALAIAGVTGCSSQPPAEPPPGTLPRITAQVTVNGTDTGTTAANCSQVLGAWTISTGDDKAGVTAVVDTGDTVSAKSVQIRNLAGFSGTSWEGHAGDADATLLGDTWVISGTVEGFKTDDPTKPATALFKIRANC
jgi:hypothetical protein